MFESESRFVWCPKSEIRRSVKVCKSGCRQERFLKCSDGVYACNYTRKAERELMKRRGRVNP
jgi:hypothetical protein